MSGAGAGIPFVDFRAHVAAHRSEIDAAIARVLDSGWFILGPEGEAFEKELAQACGARDAVAVANGTEALQLGLLALGVGPGDEVVTSPLSAAFTALAVMAVGARPVFADLDPKTLNVAPDAVARAVTSRTRTILPVHLYGHPAEMGPLLDLARAKGIPVLEDACQAVGALHEGQPVGTLAGEKGLGALSFYPTKNLGALGDGGALVVND
ncbi:MAG TPA: DegT/DnrJ/EryC1/StrS family aminotransferase, partial [Vicinamibacteria bacterium]